MNNLIPRLIRWTLTGSLLSVCATAHAELQTREIDYQVGGETFTGYLAYDSEVSGPRPGVLIVHEWWGHGEYVRQRADMLARLGYAAFALDMYGSDKYADHPSQANEFMQAVMSDREAAKARFTEALSVLREQPMVAPDDIAALGYCFGGAVVLNMARAGVDLDGVVSYHGMLATDSPAQPGEVKAAVRVFNGEADPMVPAEQVADFEAEMTRANVDYEVVNYPGAKHGFTNPEASELGRRFELPLAYDASADADSWHKTQQFLEALFR
ncbi:dienelactone hydrolase family protein [Marinimicrobium sp. C6131]|uniref:dienelactone hydrolase family protein n=1 Tax=Marinimicrobium sp. C6131 TaxID=3022676 RepID=UPI00223C9FFA|nr:dienelactone hydrolase family protein [Marinimicrobium sp. C6131]UZJ45693.1 dienelactone hydrolase family protein [Marinimicrobium sp. C6131]